MRRIIKTRSKRVTQSRKSIFALISAFILVFAMAILPAITAYKANAYDTDIRLEDLLKSGSSAGELFTSYSFEKTNGLTAAPLAASAQSFNQALFDSHLEIFQSGYNETSYLHIGNLFYQYENYYEMLYYLNSEYGINSSSLSFVAGEYILIDNEHSFEIEINSAFEFDAMAIDYYIPTIADGELVETADDEYNAINFVVTSDEYAKFKLTRSMLGTAESYVIQAITFFKSAPSIISDIEILEITQAGYPEGIRKAVSFIDSIYFARWSVNTMSPVNDSGFTIKCFDGVNFDSGVGGLGMVRGSVQAQLDYIFTGKFSAAMSITVPDLRNELKDYINALIEAENWNSSGSSEKTFETAYASFGFDNFLTGFSYGYSDEPSRLVVFQSRGGVFKPSVINNYTLSDPGGNGNGSDSSSYGSTSTSSSISTGSSGSSTEGTPPEGFWANNPWLITTIIILGIAGAVILLFLGLKKLFGG